MQLYYSSNIIEGLNSNISNKTEIVCARITGYTERV